MENRSWWEAMLWGGGILLGLVLSAFVEDPVTRTAVAALFGMGAYLLINAGAAAVWRQTEQPGRIPFATTRRDRAETALSVACFIILMSIALGPIGDESWQSVGLALLVAVPLYFLLFWGLDRFFPPRDEDTRSDSAAS